MFQLTFGKLTFQQKEDFELENSDLPEFAKAALKFCDEWLSGKSTFAQQTSGSTGVPKQIQISRAQMLASAKGTQSFFQTDDNTRLLCCLDPRYIAGKMMLVRAMAWNCQIELTEPRSKPLLEIANTPDFAAMVPLQVEACLDDNTALEKLKKIKHLIIGGAPISGALKEKLLLQRILAYQTYGMTETVSHIALAKIDTEEPRYRALPGVDFGLDERNTLWVRSAASNHELVQTNDMVEILADRSFRWLGRIDFVINSGAIKLHPEQLEKKVEAEIWAIYPDVSYFFFGKPDAQLGEKLCLLVEGQEDTKKANSLREALEKNLGKYEVPKNIYYLREFVRTESGKINRPKTIATL